MIITYAVLLDRRYVQEPKDITWLDKYFKVGSKVILTADFDGHELSKNCHDCDDTKIYPNSRIQIEIEFKDDPNQIQSS